jgi:DNA-binding MarR family transcriptional regulator
MCSTYDATPAIRSVDEHLARLRQVQSRPDYRQRLLAGVEGVTGVGTLRVLRAIERAESRGRSPSIRDIAADLEIEHSTASRAVNETTRLGLIAREPCDDDQRRARLTLTDAGRSAANRATGNRRRIVEDALAGWTASEVDQLDHLLGRLVSGMARTENHDAGARPNRVTP